MAKSFKYKDNMYLDSSGVTHNRGLLSTLLTTINNNISSLLGRPYIVETGSSGGLNYIKWSNGLMIVHGTKTYSGLNITSQWGAWYETPSTIDLGTWPTPFKETPTMTALCTGGSTTYLEVINNRTATNIGNTWFARPNQYTNTSTTISYIAIGKWK